MNGAPTTAFRSSTNATISSTSVGAYPSLSSAIGTDLFTIVISPPPTSFFDFTSEKSGSTPVVSQSIMKLIVPVGARTVAWAFRYPCTSPRSRTASQARRQERSEVRVTEPELAEGLGGALDLRGRVRRVANEDLLREEHHVDRVLERLDVKLAVLAPELHQVERREVASTVINGHVLRAGVRRVDPAGVRQRVPLVDRRVVLDARIRALPRRVGDLVQELARVDGIHDGAVGAGGEVPLAAVLDGLHERVRDADRVVRVLVLDRGPVARVERHVVASGLEDARLLLLVRLAPDELLDVRVVDVEDDHLRGAPRLAARLDRSRGGVGAAHEAHGAARVAALRELLLRGAQAREVDPGARAAAEDDPLAADPVEDRLHRVLDREDEASTTLRALLEADVEPDRRVEGCELVDEDRLQLGLERF